MKVDKTLWKKVGYVEGGKNRRKVFLGLSSPMTPTSLSNRVGLSLNITSRALRELNKTGLVKCLTPRLKVGRLYSLTKIGERVLKLIKKK